MRKINLQIFAESGNNGLNVRTYQKDFKGLLQAVFKKQAYFADFFTGGLEALDGVQHNETAFYVKTSDIPVVFSEGNKDENTAFGYNIDKNTAFGAGTGKSSRFGERTEIIYYDTPVNYSWGWVFHEGIDRNTVNNGFDVAVADRLELQAQAKTQKFNIKHSEFIATSAGHSETLSDYTGDAVLALFNNLAKYFTNKHAIGERVAKVNAELYNAIVDHPLTTSGKKSGANIDENGIVKFKGFIIEEVPEDVLASGCIAYAYIRGVAKAFTGINTARTIESEDFDGVALQGEGKAGEYIPVDNKKAVVKVSIGA